MNTLKPHDTQTLSIRVQYDSTYTVSVSFENGATLKQSLGYVTFGLRYWDQIDVTTEKASLNRLKVMPAQ
jgi:hypothetical protein